MIRIPLVHLLCPRKGVCLACQSTFPAKVTVHASLFQVVFGTVPRAPFMPSINCTLCLCRWSHARGG